MSYRRNSTSELDKSSCQRSWTYASTAPTLTAPHVSWSRAVTFYFLLIIQMVCPPSLPGGFFCDVWSQLLLRRGGKGAKSIMWSGRRKQSEGLTEFVIWSPGPGKVIISVSSLPRFDPKDLNIWFKDKTRSKPFNFKKPFSPIFQAGTLESEESEFQLWTPPPTPCCHLLNLWTWAGNNLSEFQILCLQNGENTAYRVKC